MKGLRKLPAESMTACQPMNAMVDIAFLLLIFFIVATTIQPRERDLPLGKPIVPDLAEEPTLPTVIEVTADGGVVWGDGDGALMLDSGAAGRHLPVLEENLSAVVSSLGAESVCILLRADEQARQQRVIDVLDAIAAAGIGTVMLDDPD